MTASLTRPPLALDASRAELARLCRALCLEAYKEPSKGGARLEESALAVLETVRASFAGSALEEDDLWDTLAQEQQRVTDAAVVAELLLPKLQQLLSAKVASPAPETSTARTTRDVPAAENITPPAAEPAPSGAPLGIADLLEGMLDQQRGELRQRGRSTSRG